MSDIFPPAKAGQALLLKANLTSHLLDYDFITLKPRSYFVKCLMFLE